MTSARLILTLTLLLAPAAAAQGTPPAEPPAWEGQYTDGQVTVTLYPRGEAVAGSIDIGGSFHLLRAKVAPGGGQLSGSFFAGAAGFGFDARLDQDVLLLKSGGKSFRLKRRAPTQATDEVNPLLAPPRQAPAAGDGPDLSHVKAGQRYVYEMQNNMQQIWTVKEVGADFVKYEMSMIMGGNPLGDPTTQEWKYVAPPEGARRRAPRPQADVKLSREKVSVGGVEFDCMVSEASGYKSWMSMSPGSDTVWTFPGVLKTVQLSDDSVIMELVRIEE